MHKKKTKKQKKQSIVQKYQLRWAGHVSWMRKLSRLQDHTVRRTLFWPSLLKKNDIRLYLPAEDAVSILYD